MECTVLGKRRTVLARLDGEIDNLAATKARRIIEREIKRSGAINVAFDFGGVTFMDSSGIGMIIGRYKTVSALGGKVVICDMSERIKRLVQMAGIDRIAIVADTLGDGLNRLKSEETRGSFSDAFYERGARV